MKILNIKNVILIIILTLFIGFIIFWLIPFCRVMHMLVSEHIRAGEIDTLNTYLTQNSEYEIIHIPDWVEMPPTRISVTNFRYYHYLLQDEEDRNAKSRTIDGRYVKTFVGKLVYPCESKYVAQKWYNKLNDEEQEMFHVVGNCIILKSRDEVLESVLEDADKYYDSVYKE